MGYRQAPTQIIKRLDSIEDMVKVARQFRVTNSRIVSNYFDGRTLQECCDYVLRGANEAETKPILELLEKIDAAVHDRKRNEWTPEVAGAYACVPDYLMGLPDNMRTMTRVDSDQSPVSIYVESSLSGSLGALATARRGAAIAALAMRMGEERPVELHVFKTSQTPQTQVCWAIKLDSHPVNAAQCMAVFGTAAFCRAVGWAYLGMHCPSRNINMINFGLGHPGDPGRKDRIRKVYDLNPQDIIIEAGYAPDEMLLQSDPVEWVHKQMAKQRKIEED